jgi:hypothetical protein
MNSATIPLIFFGNLENSGLITTFMKSVAKNQCILSVVMLNVAILSVVMLTAMAPFSSLRGHISGFSSWCFRSSYEGQGAESLLQLVIVPITQK